MKRIFVILSLFIIVLNSYAQSELERDIIKAEEEIYIRDTTLKDWVDVNAPSATAREAANGLSIDGNNVVLGNSALDRETTINGAGNILRFGEEISKLLDLEANVSRDFIVKADDDIELRANNVTYIWDGAYWINTTTNDTLATLDDVNTLIAASEAYQPLQFKYRFSPTTTDSRPGAGVFRLNNATPQLATEIYIDVFDIDNFNQDDFIRLIDTGSYWLIYEDNTTLRNYKITGGIENAGNYFKLFVTHQYGEGGAFTSAEILTHTLDISGAGGGIDSTLVSFSDTLTLKGDSLLGDSINAVFKSISTSDFISSADSFNFKSLGVRFDKQITNLDYLSGNAQSYIALFDEYLTLYYGNQTSASDILIDTNVIEIEPGLFGSYTDKFAYHFYNDKLYIINVTDTIFTFDTDTLLSDSIHGSFKSLSTVDTLFVGVNGHKLFENSDGDLEIESKDGQSLLMGLEDIGGAYLYASDKVTIDGDVDVDINSNLNVYSFIDDTLFAVEEHFSTKSLSAEQTNTDTLIMGSDTTTAILDLKTAIESETFDSITTTKLILDTINGKTDVNTVVIDSDLYLTGGLFRDIYEAFAYEDPDSTIVTSLTTTFSFLGGGADNKFTNTVLTGFSFDGDTLQFDQLAADARDSVAFRINYNGQNATSNVNKTVFNAIFVKHVGEDYVEIRPLTKQSRTTTADVYYPGPTCTQSPIWLKDGDKIQIRAKCSVTTTTLSTKSFSIYLYEK